MDRADLTQEPGANAPEAGPAARFGRSLAVVVGIDAYGDGIAPLRSAVADARAVAEALGRDHGFEVWSLFDGDADLPALLALLRERLPAALGPQDRLLLYFAGHGIALDGDAGPAGYLVPARARRAAREGFLPMHALHDELTRLPVRHALVILDCCFAGTFRWSSLRDLEPAAAKVYRERYDRYLESAAWQVLTSASSDQLALDILADGRGDGGDAHSPFARALLEALAGAADYTADNLITADELAIYVRERVAPAAEAAGRSQVPQLFPLARHDAGQFVFQVPGRALALVPAPALDEHANPYRGLSAFGEADRALFFGRDAAAARLTEAVIARQLTVVTGPSGSGKSSLVQAGLVPALRAQGWTVLPSQRPGREPLAALDAWTRALGAPLMAGAPAVAWVAAVAAATAVPRGEAAAAPERRMLVIIDQLEELATHRTAARDRTELFEALAAALRVAPLLHLVVTVRADAEPQLQDAALAPWWAAARFTVPAMTRGELREAIERPATAAVLVFEPSRLVDRLIDDVALVPSPLPLLSFALSELYRRCWARWQRGDRDRALREADYDELGGVAGALTRRATAVYDELVAEDAAYARTIRNVVTRMVAVIGGEVARRRVPRGELVYGDPAEDQRVDEVLQRFAAARLISLGTEPRDGAGEAIAYAEPTHDELVRGWTKVSQWLDELDAIAGARALLAALGDGARAWKASARDGAYLWNDPRVELVSALRRSGALALNADEARFTELSARQRRARRRRLIGGLLAVIAVLAVAAGVALWQRGRAAASAEEARRQLVRSYQEAGRQLLFEGRPLRALSYFLGAREHGEDGPVLRMLFWAAARTVPRPLQHQGAVTSAAFSPDGARVVTASVDGTARVWDAATGEAVSPPLAHAAGVNGAAFSPDGARVVTASNDGTARVWDAATGRAVSPPLAHRGAVTSAAFSPDGARVVTASKDSTARVWDAATGEPRSPILAHRGAVTSAAFSPDGARVLTASDDSTARIWDAATGEPRSPALAHDRAVQSAAFSPDGARVLTVSGYTARVWDAATGEPLSPVLAHESAVNGAALSPGGARVVTAGDDSTARVWDVATGASLPLQIQHERRVSSVAFSADGTRIVTGSDDLTARVWDAATGEPLSPLLEHRNVVQSVAFSPDGARVVTAGWGTAAYVWDVGRGMPRSEPLEHRGPVRAAAFSPDGTRVVTASDDRTARVWDAATTRPATAPLEHRAQVIDAAFSPDGARIVTASWDHTARVWDAATGAPVTPPLQHPDAVNSAAFSPDGARVLTAGDAADARVWDAATGRPLLELLEHRGSVKHAAFSPDGTRIVTASFDMTARVWDAATGRPVTPPLAHEGTVQRAAFSPDGARVVTASSNGTARVWDAATGAPLSPPLAHQDAVNDAAFSPDGARVVTASSDHTARIWDAVTGRSLTLPLEHSGPVRRAAFSPDGTRVLTASADLAAAVWDASTGKRVSPWLMHGRPVNGAAFSADGLQVVTASADGTARIWGIPLDDGSLAAWRAIEARSPFQLVDSFVVPRP